MFPLGMFYLLTVIHDRYSPKKMVFPFATVTRVLYSSKIALTGRI
jgi:hypothetical protein